MSKQFSILLDGLLDGHSLSEQQAYGLMMKLAEGELPEALSGALLAGLRAKGETADEIRGFATAMRALAVHPKIPAGAPTVDTVGTGGDGSGSLNLSTGTGLLGQPVDPESSNTVTAQFQAAPAAPTCLSVWVCHCRCTNNRRSPACKRLTLRSCLHRLITQQ